MKSICESLWITVHTKSIYLYKCELKINNSKYRSRLAGYNGVFKVTDKNSNFYFAKSITDHDFSVFSISQGAYETQALKKEFERVIIDEGYLTGTDYPFTIKPDFSTQGRNL